MWGDIMARTANFKNILTKQFFIDNKYTTMPDIVEQVGCTQKTLDKYMRLTRTLRQTFIPFGKYRGMEIVRLSYLVDGMAYLKWMSTLKDLNSNLMGQILYIIGDIPDHDINHYKQWLPDEFDEHLILSIIVHKRKYKSFDADRMAKWLAEEIALDKLGQYRYWDMVDINQYRKDKTRDYWED